MALYTDTITYQAAYVVEAKTQEIILPNLRPIKQIFPEEEHKNAIDVAWCESRWKKNSINSDGEMSVGIFQINTHYHDHPIEKLKDPYYNTKVAYELWEKFGWEPWRFCGKKLGLL